MFFIDKAPAALLQILIQRNLFTYFKGAPVENALSAIRMQGHGASTPFGTVLDIIGHFDAKRHFAEIWRHSVGYTIQQGGKVLSLYRHSRIATQANSPLIDDQSGLCHAQKSGKMSSEQFL